MGVFEGGAVRFEYDPGLSIVTFIADVTPIDANLEVVDVPIAQGTMVVVHHGTFRGFIGHVHKFDDLANVHLREGTPELWWDYDKA